MNVNDIIHGFCVLEKKEMAEIDSTMYVLEHIQSGASLVYLENEDTNKCFAAGFRTLPNDSTGVCHIIEHSLLCGSEKYPLKEPFVNLLKGSLSTFLNAFTANDWTMYPVASQNEKDFQNLMSCYLDAVFHPLSVIDEKPFLQEGWHIEMKSKDDTPSYKGVVYNEMKGAMSSVDEQLSQHTLRVFYAGTGYQENSGGDPEVIPTLTYKAYQDFYHKHYHPQNCFLYLYGKMNLEEKLQFMNEEYLSKYQMNSDKIVIPMPEAHINREYNATYAIGEEEKLENNTYMSLMFALDPCSDFRDVLAMDILNDALFSTNDSPIKKRLIEAHLGEDIQTMMVTGSILPAFYVSLVKTNPEEKERFYKVLLDSVQEYCEKGFDSNVLLASINHREFVNKEKDSGGFPLGLEYVFSLMSAYNYHLSYSDSLEMKKHFDYFKEHLQDRYFENLLTRIILHSKHYVEVVLHPSLTLAKEKEIAMTKKMEDLKASLSEQEINKLVQQTQTLLAYQSKKDTVEELNTLPKLAKSDLTSKVNTFPTVRKENVIEHKIFTRGIAYLKMYFDLSVLEEKDLGYAVLLSWVLSKLDTAKHDASTLQTLIQTYLGLLNFSLLTSGVGKEDVVAKLAVHASALDEFQPQMGDIVNEVLNQTIFAEDKIQTILVQRKNSLRNKMIQDGMNLAMKSASAGLTKSGKVAILCDGYTMYQFVEAALKNLPETIECMKKVLSVLLQEKNYIYSLTGDEEILSRLAKTKEQIKLGKDSIAKKLNVCCDVLENKALVIPSQVNYNAKAMITSDFGVACDGKMNVLAHILRYDYLWPEVRVKGGAYGCRLQVIPQNNMIVFGSYRDPNVLSTYDTYNNVSNYLQHFTCSEQEFLTYLIGAIGAMDKPVSLPQQILMADQRYFVGITDEMRSNVIQQMMETRREDMKEFIPLFDSFKEVHQKVTIGNETTIQKDGTFTKITKLA
jgi:Zn-dependent M16 (insulinase) family peptidase